MSGLKQINISYSKVEDRLLMEIRTLNDEEIGLWLTYHFTSKILEALNTSLSRKNTARFGEATARQVLQADKAVAAEQAVSHISTPVTKTPPKQTTPAKLVTSIAIKPLKDEYSITLGDVNEDTVTINLPKPILLSVIDSLEKKAAEAEWMFPSTIAPLAAENISMVKH